MLAGAIAQLGTKRTLVVSGSDGLGDVTLAGTTNVSDVASTGGATAMAIREFTWQPEDFGIPRTSLDALRIDGPAASAAVIRKLLTGERGPARDIVVLNAAAGLFLAGKASSAVAAANLAGTAIDSGAAADLLARLVERSHAAA